VTILPPFHIHFFRLKYITIQTARPALFGPERPLAQLVKEGRLSLDHGKLKNVQLLVNKAQRRLELWVRRRMVKAYRIQLGWNAHGSKVRQGDRRTPEGTYFVCAHRPSNYYLGLWLGYPDIHDARRGLASGLIGPDQYKAVAERLAAGLCPPMTTGLGGDILIHLRSRQRGCPVHRPDIFPLAPVTGKRGR
jgi:hypothetical protein